jgi:hypothetical protein
MLIREVRLFTIRQRYFLPNWRERNFRLRLLRLRGNAKSEEDSVESRSKTFLLSDFPIKNSKAAPQMKIQNGFI